MAYCVTVFLSAFLLFQVQPLIGKYILPWFGGAPSVWATCLLFFQVLLLGGYAYAHLLSGRLSARRQGLVHLGVVLLSVGLLAGQAFAWATPILPGASFKPEDSSQPIGRILILLTLGVGLPYLLLASTSPLVQAWFHRDFPALSPYRLYVLSNVGSMLALLSYPFLIEPSLRLSDQARVWGGLYVAFALGVAWLALRIRRSRLACEAYASGARASPPPEPPGRNVTSRSPRASDPAMGPSEWGKHPCLGGRSVAEVPQAKREVDSSSRRLLRPASNTSRLRDSSALNARILRDCDGSRNAASGVTTPAPVEERSEVPVSWWPVRTSAASIATRPWP